MLMLKKVIFVFLFVAISGFSHNPIVVISIDGLRADAIRLANATKLLSIIKDGNHFTRSSTIDLSLTLPSHTSMLTGLDYTQHGITWNDYQPEKGVVQFPTFLELSKKSGLKTAMFITKDKLKHLLRPNSVDYFEQTEKKGDSVAKAFKNYVSSNGLADVTFIHIPDPDVAGHTYGWLSPNYIKAVKDADKAANLIIESAKQQNKDAVFIISADHGGTFFEHLLPIESNRHTPMIVYGKNIKKNQTITIPVKIYDIAATVLKLNNISLPDNFRGVPLPLVLEEESLVKK